MYIVHYMANQNSAISKEIYLRPYFLLCSSILTVGMGDYENMSQRLLFLQVSRLLATLHMYVDFIQQSN